MKLVHKTKATERVIRVIIPKLQAGRERTYMRGTVYVDPIPQR